MNAELLKKKERNAANAWGACIFFLLIFIDLITKLVADVYFAQTDAKSEIVLIPNICVLRMAYNRGISFGIGATASKGVKLGVLLGTSALMLAFAVCYFRLGKERKLLRIALLLVVAGGVGNLIDRLYYRVWDTASYAGGFRDGVRDMIDLTFSFIGFSAVCNLADFWITFGAIALVLALLFFDRDAVFPVGKYKAEAAERERAQKEEKAKKADRKNRSPEGRKNG